MKAGDTGLFFRELIAFLPRRQDEAWCALSHAENPRGTVVVVSGFGATHRSVAAIRKRLLKDGFDVTIVAMNLEDMQDGLRGLSHVAARLKSVVDSLSTKPGPVLLVAHSAGGLVARYFLQCMGGASRCKALVLLGTPHQGTWVAALGFLTHLVVKARVLWEMLPVSSFIKELNTEPIADSVAVLSIRSDSDRICPPQTTRLPTAWEKLPNVLSIDMPGLTHIEFLMNKDCYARVSEFLRQQIQQPGGPVRAIRSEGM